MKARESETNEKLEKTKTDPPEIVVYSIISVTPAGSSTVSDKVPTFNEF